MDKNISFHRGTAQNVALVILKNVAYSTTQSTTFFHADMLVGGLPLVPFKTKWDRDAQPETKFYIPLPGKSFTFRCDMRHDNETRYGGRVHVNCFSEDAPVTSIPLGLRDHEWWFAKGSKEYDI